MPWRERVGGWDVALALLAFFVLSPLLGGLISRLLPTGEVVLTASIAGYGPALLLGVGITVLLPVTKANRVSLGLVLPSLRWLLIGCAAGLLTFLADYGVLWGYATLAGGLPADPDPEYTRAFDAFVARHTALAFASVSLLAPVAEEAFFRGLLHGYLRRWGPVVALALSSTLFGVAHGLDPFVTPSATLFGVAMVLLYERSGSLLTAMAAHGIHNALLFAPLPTLPS